MTGTIPREEVRIPQYGANFTVLTANPAFKKKGKTFWSDPDFRLKFEVALRCLTYNKWVILDFSREDNQISGDSTALANLAHLVDDIQQKSGRSDRLALIANQGDITALEFERLDEFFTIYVSREDFLQNFFQS